MASMEKLVSAARLIPPLVTPLRPDGRVDESSLSRLVAHVLDAGADGVLVLGSTGEGGQLSDDAREAVVAAAARQCAGQAMVMAGVHALDTASACARSRRLAAAGADIVLAPAPLALDLSQVELASHFRAVAAAAPVPVVAYNVPVRTPSSPTPETVGGLAGAGVLAGVKDSSGDLAGQRELVRVTRRQPGFALLTGSETCIDMALLAGFTGAVPGLSNVWPDRHVGLLAAAAAGDWPRARKAQDDIADLAQLYRLPSVNGRTSGALGALKEALVQRGVIESSTLTAPLTPPGPDVRREVKDFLAARAGAGPT